MTWWYGRLAGWIARGYRPDPPRAADIVWMSRAPVAAGSLVAFCPTMVLPGNEVAQREAIAGLHRQLVAGVLARRLPETVLIVSYLDLSESTSAARARLDRLLADLATDVVPVSAFHTRTKGKINALNVALRAALVSSAAAFLQVDDDIRLDPGTVDELYRAYRDADGQVAVGATKIGASRLGWSSRLMRWGKRHTRSAENFPHACCMMLHPSLLPDGIPPKYLSDDRYLCFSLLRPGKADPLENLRLVSSARCHYLVGGPARQAVGRIRRILLSTHVLLADFPEDVSSYYFREIMFPQFAPLGARHGPISVRAWLTQALYFLWFLAVACELMLRGATGLPLRRLEYNPVRDRSLPPAMSGGTT